MRNYFPENLFTKAIAEGRAPIGFMNYIRDANIMDIAGAVGMDFVVIDQEHGVMDRETVCNQIMAAELNGITPIVRVPELIPYLIRAYMECGARGIMLPNVQSAEDALAGQRALRYPPEGTAGCCRFIHGDRYRPSNWMAYQKWVEDVCYIPMIEDPKGFENLDGILDVLKPGRDMIMFGKADFGSALGTINPDGTYSSAVTDYYLKTIEKCRSRNIAFMAVPSSPASGQTAADVQKVIDEGCSACCLGTDIGALADAYARIAEQCRDMRIR